MNRRTMLALPTGALLCMAPNGRPALAQQKPGFIVQANYWALPGKVEEVYQWRMHASDVIERLGLRRGQVFRRQANSETLPHVIHQTEYLNEAERMNNSVTSRGPSAAQEYQEVVKHMMTLVCRYETSVWLPN